MTINFDQFDPADAPPPAPATKSKGPVYFFIASLGVLVVVSIIILFTSVIGRGRDLAETPSQPVVSQKSTEAEPAEPSNTPLDDSALQQAMQSSTCSDPMADATPVFDFVLAATSSNKWNEKTQKIVTNGLATLNRTCRQHVPHLLAVQHALVDPQAPPQLNSLVKDANWISRQHPAPSDAQIPTGRFTTGLRNIHCSIESGGASCTINKYLWPAPAKCEGSPATFRIDASMEEPVGGCTSPVVAETEYEYGTTLANNGYACSVEATGISCWSEFTGHGFELSREKLRKF
ncbi:hypothetical protein SAMN04489737_0302 [Arcanobacterium phocae]|uniref:Uncharacterized protein n=1 Tax=Arcanobacterium phocae TaxID=131112 RepID=A0A1H2LAJ3_9ACTO|nr:hypothetical protein [Arcanobacterium phocae]SDU78057.1 hypothetical protein SAMN04489737_0302 [Arcanobacterium phocae]